MILPPKGHLIMSGDILSYHNLVWVDATGIYFGNSTAKHSVMHRTAPPSKKGITQLQMPVVQKLRNPGEDKIVCSVPPVGIEHTSEESKLAIVGRDTGEHPCEL